MAKRSNMTQAKPVRKLRINKKSMKRIKVRTIRSKRLLEKCHSKT